MSDANRLICNGCLAPIELGRSFTWYMNKPYHNHCAVSQPLITRAEADAMVAAERAIWTRAIESYFDATAVMDVEKHVERLRAEGRKGEGGEMMEQHGVWLMMEGWNALIAEAQAEAGRAMMKYPQPNYVISKIAEEAGEVVKSAIHCAEGRDVPENVRGEMIQLIAMLYRLWVEGDQVHGLSPVQWWIKGEGQQ